MMPSATGPGRIVQGLSALGVRLAAACQFLTITPPLVQRLFTPKELGAAVGFFPVPGLLIGLLVAGAHALLLPHAGPLLTGAVTLTIWVIATGALHLDGLLDTCDGLFGGHTPERRMEIMRDHHIGAFALAGGVLLLLCKWAALAEFASGWQLLALTPVIARGGLSLAVVTQPYARPQGTGAALKANAGVAQAVLAALLMLVAALVLGGWRGLAASGWALLAQAAVVALVRAKIPGLTGDSYGALVEIGELAVLVYLAIS